MARCMGWSAVMVATLAMTGTPVVAEAPQRSGFRIDWSSIGAGGELISMDAASGYEVGGSIGLPDAGHGDGNNAVTGAGYALYGGYWSIVRRDDRLFANGFELP